MLPSTHLPNQGSRSVSNQSLPFPDIYRSFLVSVEHLFSFFYFQHFCIIYFISFISSLSLGFITLTALCLPTGAFSPQTCNITTEIIRLECIIPLLAFSLFHIIYVPFRLIIFCFSISLTVIWAFLFTLFSYSFCCHNDYGKPPWRIEVRWKSVFFSPSRHCRDFSWHHGVSLDQHQKILLGAR